MSKAKILGANYVDGKPTLFICYFWDGSEWNAFYYGKHYHTLNGAKRGLQKMGFTEIVEQI